MTAVAVGAATFVAAVVTIFLGALVPAVEALNLVAQLAALVAVVAFFAGFAPPSWVRRAWREPDLRRFLERSVHLAAVPDDRAALTELQQAVAAAFGATGATVGLADLERGVIRYVAAGGTWVEYPSDAFIAGRAFTKGRRLVALDAAQEDPEHAPAYVGAGARTVIAAPITSEERRIGVLTVYAEREPIFVEDDLWLLELLAGQAAVLLEARTLSTHASELRSREDAAHLKEEFLSAAAHDLRTPLTVVLGQAELLERRLARNPEARIDAASVARIVREARRLRDLISELLDAQRLEQGRAIGELAPADLLGIVDGVRDRHAAGGARREVEEADEPVIVAIDRARIEQVLENLVENALKYGQPGQAPLVRVRRERGEGTVSVVDGGMGIPDTERSRIFERFFRASNARSVTDTGLGLGLYICRRIVEEHGGRIWHEPTPGGGSTFSFSLPLVASDTEARAAAEGAPAEPAWTGQLERGGADA
jgi:signal transduction histidine kinase